MPEGGEPEVRIYCICGQKMRVSEAMFGLPGKCVACRQKIRIPNREEIPPGATRIYLKDHPEFLRKSQKPAGEADVEPKAKPEAEEADVPLGEPSEPVSTVMLDILEPLRTLCSLEHKVQRQIAALGVNESDARREDLSVLKGYRDRIKSARAEVDEQLRQRLLEVAIDLSNTQEKIVQAGLSARLGEVDFAAYCDTVDTLRRHRNRLERMQQNLRAWVAVADPHAAGGYANVSLDDLPPEGFRVELPPEIIDPRSLLDQHIDLLREALARRERAENRLQETERVQAEGTMPPLVIADCRADIDAEKKRAEAEAVFQRQCLGNLAADLANDALIIESCLDRLEQQGDSGTGDKAHSTDGRFAQLMQAHEDQEKINNLVSKALVANAAYEVPYPKGTFLKRIAHPPAPARLSADIESWFAWGSALVMGLAAFLPMVDDLSPLEAYRNLSIPGDALHWIMFGPVLAGALVTVVGALPWKRPRAILLAFLWLSFTVAMALLIHESQYGTSAIAVRFCQGGIWLLRPGSLLLILGNIGLFVAMSISLMSYKNLRLLIPILIALAAILLIAIKTDMGGYFTPRPVFSTQANMQIDPTANWYDALVVIDNIGGRQLVLCSSSVSARSAFIYSLDRQTNRGEWENVGAPERIERSHSSDANAALKPVWADLRSMIIGARENVALHYRLSPGKYRARLVRNTDGAYPIEKVFDLEKLPFQKPTEEVGLPTGQQGPHRDTPAKTEMPAVSAASATAPNAVAPPSSTAIDKTSALGSVGPQTGVEVELRGLITAGRRDPRFSIMLHFPDGTDRPMDVTLGDALLDSAPGGAAPEGAAPEGAWTITEFNPARQTVTIVNQGRLLILNRGQRISLD